MQGTNAERNEKYNQYVKSVTPKHNTVINCLKAFVTGGTICTLGQVITNIFMIWHDTETAAVWTTICLVLISTVLTAFNIYPQITKWGGAGALVPITGFANSVASAAIEYQKEGQVFGIGCKIFTIAGPVILYGLFSSWLLGLIYWIMTMVGM